LTGTTPWSSTDPYQFKIADADMGVIDFNPMAYSYKENGNWSQPLTAYIDYTILDLQIIHEDRKVPDGATSSADARLNVKLSLAGIKEKGVTAESNNTVYAGIGTSSALRHNVVAVDTGTGTQYNEESGIVVDGDDEQAFTVDYKNGVIKFNHAFSGRTFRIFYRAEGDWMVQISKPYNLFSPVNDMFYMGTYPSLYNSYCMVTDAVNQSIGAVVFSRCYSGDSVAVDYTYEVNGKEYSVTGDVFVISKATNNTIGGSKLAYINIGANSTSFGESRLHQIWGDSVTIENLKVSRIYGVSAGARVMWRNGGRGLFAGRWKTAELQTYLPRSGN